MRWVEHGAWTVGRTTPVEACARILHGLPPLADLPSGHLRLAVSAQATAIAAALASTPHPSEDDA